MKRGFVKGLVAALAALALLAGGLSGAWAEGTLLPPSALLMRQSQVLTSGDYFVQTPDASFDKMSAAEVDTLYKAMRAYEPKASSLLVNEAQYYYYYDHLDPVSKEIYDLILQVARDPVSEGNVQVMMTPIDPMSDRFQYAYAMASFAVTFDHPELYWLYNTCQEADISISGEHRMVNGRYTVFFRIKEPFNEFEAQMTAFNRAAEEFLAGIDRNASQYDVVKQVHDKLIDMVTYDTVACGKREFDLAHTAYGALVANSAGDPHFAVCDGYSLAFEYLLQQCGITATFIGGYGGDSPLSLGGHAWSMVSVDGAWYEVDSTWDDNQIDEAGFEPYRDESWYDYMIEVIRDPEFREKLGHFLFLVSTDRMEHYTPQTNVDWVFDFGGGMGSINMAPSESYHERDGAGMVTGEEMDDPYGGVIFLAPRAERDYNA